MTETDLLVLATVLGTSFMTCVLLVLTQRWHGRLSLDHDLQGVQKIHKRPVPRIGGIGIGVGMLAGAVAAQWVQHPHAPVMLALTLCAVPAFGAGLLEDVTKRVSVRTRLAASFVSALCAVWIADALLMKLDTPGLDLLMTVPPLAVLFTCFAVGGVTNAVNIIDGVNGLASGSVAIMLGGISAIATLEGDGLVALLALSGIAALLGFMTLNYPFGKIFLGDGGAYFAGFWLAECAVLLLARNPEVSTWGVLLTCAYPVCETLFSMFRRHVLQGVTSGAPDSNHFHHLVLQLFNSGAPAGSKISAAHGLTSSVIWLPVLACQIAAVSGYLATSWMIICNGTFCIAYSLAYVSCSQATKKGEEQESTNGIAPVSTRLSLRTSKTTGLQAEQLE